MGKKEKIDGLKKFVRNRVKADMPELEAKRVRGYIIATLGEL